MNKCDKSENQLFDSMIRFIKNGVLLVRDPHLAAKVAIIPKKWKSWLSGNFWLVSFKISYLCLPLFYETRTTPSCHPSGCAYRQL